VLQEIGGTMSLVKLSSVVEKVWMV